MKIYSTLLNRAITRILLFIVLLDFSSCTSIFIPRKQNLTINTGDKKAKVYIDKEEVGEGKSVTTKVVKSGAKQVIVKAEGRRDAYHMLLPIRRAYSFWPLFILDLPIMIVMNAEGVENSKNIFVYNKSNQFLAGDPEILRSSNNKYISIDAIGLKISNKDKDIVAYENIPYKDNLIEALDKREKEVDTRNTIKSDKISGKKKKLLDDDKKIEEQDTKFSTQIYKTLRTSGFIDTINKVFLDQTNTLNLEANITKVKVFEIGSPATSFSTFLKSKLYLTWFIKNTFDEKIDSIITSQYSANFPKGDKVDDIMFSNAVDESFHQLFKNKVFQKYLSVDTNFSISDAMLTIPAITSQVSEVSDGANATVTVKRKEGGHGSGFAISNDGYILTNYHVIAGNSINKPAEISVILSDGEEIPVKIVRFNRMRDLALLKVDRKFEKAFKLEQENSYKRLMEVYTIGTPKSLELGQSVSLGLVSNERKSNNNHLLQLSISINPGNSGGPLFEKSGKLQGVVTSKLVGFATEGVGFAIPSYKIAGYLNLDVK
jgi:serine protease Do